MEKPSTIRSTVYLDPGVDDALIAEIERMPFRRRASRLLQLLRIGAETTLRLRDGTLRGGLVRCRAAMVTTNTRMRVGIRLNGPADAAVAQLLAESPNRRTDRLRQLAQCGLEREAYWAQGGAQAFASRPREAEPASQAPQPGNPFLLLLPNRTVHDGPDDLGAAHGQHGLYRGRSTIQGVGARRHPGPTGTLLKRPPDEPDD